MQGQVQNSNTWKPSIEMASEKTAVDAAEQEQELEQIRNDLHMWSRQPFPPLGDTGFLLWPKLKLFHKDFFASMCKVGGVVGAANKIYLLRVHGTSDDMEKAKEMGEQLINDVLSLFINLGVVGALIITVIYPLLVSEINLSDKTIRFFGNEDVVLAIYYVYYALLMMSAAISLSIIFESVTFYKHLSFWMTSQEAKLQYIAKCDLAGLVRKVNNIMSFTAWAIPYGALSIVSPIAALITGGGLVYFVWMQHQTFQGEATALRIFHEDVKQF